jgi:hypothetical protein
MPKKEPQKEHFADSVIHLKTLALRDEPLVHLYRDIHYKLI